ncbi:thiamine diphosphokinase [Anaerobacillus alkaliphilus]|uniref:Thiamine diphosphokinase n=1 Tax=Anaerobacillus alkaliphilus TaxID=1548597 RepID=A0A4Q0VNX6_9BACI|nr:thiamine diphosphokinase [Anaerobacillus alkaliphilus]RXI98053.1 thiamine diphosphokinase [Anaerobacillus alkaliphilus]
MKVIKIVAGGPRECLPSLQKKENEIWIAVDKGFEHLLNHQIVPDFVLGDFDSVSVDGKKLITKQNYIQYPAEKDKTDLEIAFLHAIDESPDIIVIYGATGGRLDHELLNIQLLKQGIDKRVTVYMIDKKNKITLKSPGCYKIEKSQYQYVSFLSLFEKVEKLTLQGFRYPLYQATLNHGSSLCISNELISNKGTYSFSSGILMVVESSD